MSWEHACKLAGEPPPPKKKAAFIPGTMRKDVDWAAVEDAYVWGSELKQDREGNFTRTYPTLKQLADKYGVHMSLVHQRSKRGNWLKRRQQCEKKTREEVQKELDDKRAKSAAAETCKALEALESWIERFRDNVESGRVPATSMGDLNTAVRLRAFLRGEADSRTAQHVTHSLDELTRRHLATRSRLQATSSQASGILDVEDAGPEGAVLPHDGGEDAPPASSPALPPPAPVPATGAKRRISGAA